MVRRVMYYQVGSSTTTTERPGGGSGDKPTGVRPPATYSEEEIFLDGKCGHGDTRKSFLESCINPSPQGVTGIKCAGLRGSSGECGLDLRYTFNDAGNYRDGDVGGDVDVDEGIKIPLSNTTTATTSTTTMSSIPSKARNIPSGFEYEYNCGFGPGKFQTLKGTVAVPRDKMETVMKFCRQELYGVPGMPLWLIILIILLVITAVSITATLFWKYWLRKKLYGNNQGDRSISGYYTSAPFSSNNSSALPSSGGPRSTSKKMGRRSSGSVGSSGGGGISKQAASSANRSSNYGPYKLLSSHRIDSATGKAPSVRSGISGSQSGRTPSGRLSRPPS